MPKPPAPQRAEDRETQPPPAPAKVAPLVLGGPAAADPEGAPAQPPAKARQGAPRQGPGAGQGKGTGTRQGPAGGPKQGQGPQHGRGQGPAQGPAKEPEPRAKPAARKPLPKAFTVPEPAPAARLQTRHVALILSFLLLVAAPLGIAADYLWVRAADQYASHAGFSVRQTQASSGGGLSGLAAFAGLPALSGSAADDGNVLNEYLRSREVVALIDAQLGLARIWSRPGHDLDPVFVYDPAGSIEDLHRYWLRMVDIDHDGGSGLIAVEVRAFEARDARAVAEAIVAAASDRINTLSQIARADTIRLAGLDLDEAEARLAEAGAALTAFRGRTRIVDPGASLQGQMGLLGQLEAELAQTLIAHDLLEGTTGADDPRLVRLARKIEVIEARIGAEQAKLGPGVETTGEAAYAGLVGEYERLALEQRFAEEAYVAALAALDHARAEARRQTRYLAAHVPPTLAERAEYPRRARLLGILAAFLGLGWTLAVVTAYSLRDRR